MTTAPPPDTAASSVAAYEALRRGGVPPGLARRDLHLTPRAAARLETVFQSRSQRGAGEAQPRFARHARHVAAVMAEGGFAALSERRVGRDCIHLCLPLTRPAPERAEP